LLHFVSAPTWHGALWYSPDAQLLQVPHTVLETPSLRLFTNDPTLHTVADAQTVSELPAQADFRYSSLEHDMHFLQNVSANGLHAAATYSPPAQVLHVAHTVSVSLSHGVFSYCPVEHALQSPHSRPSCARATWHNGAVNKMMKARVAIVVDVILFEDNAEA